MNNQEVFDAIQAAAESLDDLRDRLMAADVDDATIDKLREAAVLTWDAANEYADAHQSTVLGG